MREWKFWEWLAYSTLFTSAIILALDAGLKVSPTLMAELPTGFLHSPLWGFAPLVFLLLGTMILAARGLGWIGNGKDSHPTTTLGGITVFVNDRNFFNENVEIDGTQYQKCRFKDVVLVFRGRANYTFIDCHWDGKIFIKGDHPIVTALKNLENNIVNLKGVVRFESGILDKTSGNFTVKQVFEKQPKTE